MKRKKFIRHSIDYNELYLEIKDNIESENYSGAQKLVEEYNVPYKQLKEHASFSEENLRKILENKKYLKERISYLDKNKKINLINLLEFFFFISIFSLIFSYISSYFVYTILKAISVNPGLSEAILTLILFSISSFTLLTTMIIESKKTKIELIKLNKELVSIEDRTHKESI